MKPKMKPMDPKEWMKDYADFLGSTEAPAPGALKQQVFVSIQKLLNPHGAFIFMKVLGLHIVVGSLSLAICHQFDMNPFQTKWSLADWFMAMWGHNVCMVACGLLFMGLSVWAAGFVLTDEEVRVLRRTEVVQTLALSLVSLAAFYLFGAEMAFAISALWFLGAIVGGVLASEVLWALKLQRAKS